MPCSCRDFQGANSYPTRMAALSAEASSALIDSDRSAVKDRTARTAIRTGCRRAFDRSLCRADRAINRPYDRADRTVRWVGQPSPPEICPNVGGSPHQWGGWAISHTLTRHRSHSYPLDTTGHCCIDIHSHSYPQSFSHLPHARVTIRTIWGNYLTDMPYHIGPGTCQSFSAVGGQGDRGVARGAWRGAYSGDRACARSVIRCDCP